MKTESKLESEWEVIQVLYKALAADLTGYTLGQGFTALLLLTAQTAASLGLSIAEVESSLTLLFDSLRKKGDTGVKTMPADKGPVS